MNMSQKVFQRMKIIKSHHVIEAQRLDLVAVNKRRIMKSLTLQFLETVGLRRGRKRK